ncbi:hypothetical protein [Legionella pneumophila]|uniref:hypothetical protein n=1 Tax=Legionella pneumophila TaxID=446 RepID=UPI000486BD66|nr:hypothetical protein [Legionella pneumophila]HAT1941225.1 hypothetical protein [Legionella pneumophila]HAT1990192.1 hypothetical protein [Legionella pneumophila]HAT1993363.1 hypothetical protein [Legionella pneumophila]HAT2050760.1 hypothetical protein [Legionella pneumophila]HAT2059658.1 hypothetical protein [Legionella pneumophila]
MSTSESELRISMQQYGKQAFSETQQIKILNLLLEDAKKQLPREHEIYKLIDNFQFRLSHHIHLSEAIQFVNKFIIELESKDKDSSTVNYLKQHGFYRILYRHPRLLGQELPQDDILHKLLRYGFIGVGISAVMILLFISTAFFTAPFWLTAITTGLFVGASAYLSGILYGVVNDIFATHANLPYFLLGHQPQQTSLLRTNDKVAQGIAWGVAATFGPVVLATLLFTVAATITAFFVPIATFLLPAMMIAMPLIAVGAEFYARKKAREYLDSEENFYWIGSNDYQRRGLNYMCPTYEERAAWYANSDRNLFGFTKVPLIGLGALVGLIVLSGISMFLPPVLFVSPVIAIAIPAAFSAVACATLIAGGIYMQANRNKQLDDRYRLEFERDEVESDLYLDEDMEYIRKIAKTYSQKDLTVEPQQEAINTENYSFLFDKKPKQAMPNIKQEEFEPARLSQAGA